MSRIFEKKCIEGMHLINSISDNLSENRNVRVLDVANEAEVYLENLSELCLYDIISPIEIYYISEHKEKSRVENIELSTVPENEIISNYYDLVIVRDEIPNKKFEDTLNIAYSSANKNGIVTFNLIDYHQM